MKLKLATVLLLVSTTPAFPDKFMPTSADGVLAECTSSYVYFTGEMGFTGTDIPGEFGTTLEIPEILKFRRSNGTYSLVTETGFAAPLVRDLIVTHQSQDYAMFKVADTDAETNVMLSKVDGVSILTELTPPQSNRNGSGTVSLSNCQFADETS